MVDVFTITQINYLLVRLFNDLIRPILCLYVFYICVVKFFSCIIDLVSGIATKAALLSSTSFTIF